MKPDDLPKKLHRLSVPAEDEAARGRALEHALIALRNRLPEEEAPSRGSSPAWGLLASVLILMVAVVWLVSRSGAPAETDSADLQVLNQVSELFPESLEAVVEHDGRVDVLLAPGEAPPSEQPLVLVLRKGGEILRVLSYSGREVCLSLGGRRVCMELLAGSDGNVIVAGENFVWSRQSPRLLNGYRIDAKPLNATL
jgi:hypothetical protein